MAFQPFAGQVVWFDSRPSTTAVILAVETSMSLMWIRPVDGGRPMTVEYSDRWSEMIPRPAIVEAWFLAAPAGAGGWSRAYLTRAGALAAATPQTIAAVHVTPTGDLDISYFF